MNKGEGGETMPSTKQEKLLLDLSVANIKEIAMIKIRSLLSPSTASSGSAPGTSSPCESGDVGWCARWFIPRDDDTDD